jgi:protein arginine kinase activator
MKCEKCNNEAVFHFQSNINGEKTEYHLCADCAKSAGFRDMLEFRPHSMFENFLREPFGLMDSFFKDPFGSFGTLADGFFGRSLLTPTLEAPSVNIAVGDPEKATETEAKAKDNIPWDAGEEIRHKRELFAMRHQLRAAIRVEEFEKAAELRDKIRELER